MKTKILFKDYEELKNYVGKEIGKSEQFLITQKFVNDFAFAVYDTQWIHIDPERCEKESPFGSKPVMHGLLGIALLTHLYKETLELPPFSAQINCAIEDAKFLKPVFVGDVVYGTFKLQKLGIRKTFSQLTWLNSLYNQKNELCLYAVMLNRRYH